VLCFRKKLCSRLLELACSSVERQDGVGNSLKAWGCFTAKTLFCMDLSRNSLNSIAQTHRRCYLKTHIISTISLEMCVLVHIYALYFTVVDTWRQSSGALSQKVAPSFSLFHAHKNIHTHTLLRSLSLTHTHTTSTPRKHSSTPAAKSCFTSSSSRSFARNSRCFGICGAP